MTQAVALAQQASTGVSQGFKNRIINGAMTIDQRNAGASVTGNNGTFSVDRWAAETSEASKFTMQQDAGAVTPPVGFIDYLGVTSSSAYTVGSGQTFNLYQRIEGLNISDLAWGTANAKTVTLSFWVRSSLTGTFGGAIQNNGNDRSYPFAFTISSANTWEQKSVTIAGDTTGTWLTTNGIGMRVRFSLGAGATISGTAGVWSSSDFRSATGATSVVGTNGATFYITGVQLEVGSTATSFEYLDYGRSLIQCQRYYYLWVKGNTSTTQEMGMGFYLNNTEVDVKVYLPVSMRTNPSLSQVTGTNYYRFTRSGGSDDFDSLTLERCNASNSIVSLYNDTQMSGTGGVAGNMLSFNAAAFMSFTAEL
jgi:hypothetical protein